MAISYFDSSFLLAILFNESHAEEALGVWENSPIKVSSVLLKFETNISIRRKHRSRKDKYGDDWLETKLTGLNKYIEKVFFTDIDENLENSVSEYYEDLSKCKSLDAIHLAAALKISEKHDRKEIRICSFDENMRSSARQLGFEII
jgi:predicted nucleic acid-binding protein